MLGFNRGPVTHEYQSKKTKKMLLDNRGPWPMS